jgi:hypothetical protein
MNITFSTCRAFFAGSRRKRLELRSHRRDGPAHVGEGLPMPWNHDARRQTFDRLERRRSPPRWRRIVAVLGPNVSHATLPQRVSRDEDPVDGLEEHERIHVVPGRRVGVPFEPPAFEHLAGRDRVVEVEGIGLLVEFRHPHALRGPRLHVLHLALGNGDAAPKALATARVAAHVIGVAVRVDEALERLAISAACTSSRVRSRCVQ